MIVQQFQVYIQRAKTFQDISNPPASDFWAGYTRGLRRRHHGEAFGTQDEHEAYLKIPKDERDLARRALGAGYTAGYCEVEPSVELVKNKVSFLL